MRVNNKPLSLVLVLPLHTTDVAGTQGWLHTLAYLTKLEEYLVTALKRN
jgi:hypothetical protein